tara:strand:- start:1056 stop:1157 length:102 start_codon:yes stop_codon:yes gene_type:complete
MVVVVMVAKLGSAVVFVAVMDVVAIQKTAAPSL